MDHYLHQVATSNEGAIQSKLKRVVIQKIPMRNHHKESKNWGVNIETSLAFVVS